MQCEQVDRGQVPWSDAILGVGGPQVSVVTNGLEEQTHMGGPTGTQAALKPPSVVPAMFLPMGDQGASSLQRNPKTYKNKV